MNPAIRAKIYISRGQFSLLTPGATQTLAADDFRVGHAARGIAGVDDQLRLLDNPLVVVVRVIGYDDHAVVLGKIIEVRTLHLQIVFSPLSNEGKVRVVIADLGSIPLQEFDDGERR